MLSALECERRAAELDKLAEQEREGFRKDAYRQMASWWRRSAERKPTTGQE